MSFESERNYSLQELKEMNRPPAEPAPPPPPPPPPVHPTEEDWLVLTDAAEKITAWEPEAWKEVLPALDLVSRRVLAVREAMDGLPTREQQTELLSQLRQIKELLKPDGRKNARLSSPRTSAADLWEFTKKLVLVILIILVILVALSGLLWGFFTVWKTFKTLRP